MQRYRDVAAQVSRSTIAASVDADGRLHVDRLKAIPEPACLSTCASGSAAMLPRVDLPEVLLEVMGWEPGFAAAFTSVSGGQSRLEDLDVTVAACLTAHG